MGFNQIQQYRHDARNALRPVRDAAPRGSNVNEALSPVVSTLHGIPGISQEEQVARFETALEQLDAAAATVAEADVAEQVEAAKAAQAEQGQYRVESARERVEYIQNVLAQAQRDLAEAEEAANATPEDLEAKVLKSKADVAEAVEATRAILVEAKEVAATRDFEAHQAEKGRNTEDPYAYAEGDDVDDEDWDDDEDEYVDLDDEDNDE